MIITGAGGENSVTMFAECHHIKYKEKPDNAKRPGGE
jgi:hypothetical protein